MNATAERGDPFDDPSGDPFDDPPWKTAKAARSRRLVAFPWAYLVDVCRRTRGQAPLAVAALIYRRTHVCKNQTVTLPSAELAELGVSRSEKGRALTQLANAGLVRIENMPGRTSKVTLLWKG